MSHPSVVVVIPWRGGQPDRERHHRYVTTRMAGLLPGATQLDVDSGSEVFSRAGSRNLGVRMAADLGADVVVLVDADTICELLPLLDAIQGAAQDGRLHLPYTKFRGLSPEGTKEYLAGVPPLKCQTQLETDWSTGGVLCCTPSAWTEAGGMDERFIGWGGEDPAFRVACDALLGPTVKHEGTITHLWHPEEMNTGSDTWKANRDLGRRYDEAEGDVDKVKALIAEREAVLAL